ncbi:hypothetical protein ALC53_10544 [Atta colombica]|uniref:Uncharacterized protein n=1 Tax=Atta colombica TaxID=520822 RepID=A0A195B3Y7_9HYME|nr:hypothetical protein ALC53_10544 [Atta colombica]
MHDKYHVFLLRFSIQHRDSDLPATGDLLRSANDTNPTMVWCTNSEASFDRYEPRIPVGGERLDKHGALSDGPSAAWQKRKRKRSKGGRGFGIEKKVTLTKKKVVHQTDEPVDA